jgi:hypothetical protein
MKNESRFARHIADTDQRLFVEVANVFLENPHAGGKWNETFEEGSMGRD